ncbi:MAG TPA: alpha/beta hydrolase [Acidobacteriaceae bacterium]|jgi:pimeloyl-ACP methyl ester carboxylesterase|nr:alpha/beta hydrolase [Acidobacteriaceae bacterium]
MATAARAPERTRHRGRRALLRALVGFLILLIALLIYAVVRPLTVLTGAAQVRLLFAGIHSESTEIPYAGHPTRIHYYAGGSGSPVVLVHGLGGRAEDWVNLMPQLVRDHHRVYALDLPGYGRSDWPAGAQYSIAEQAGAVEAFMNNRHLDRVDLGGWSMGGWLAMRVALAEPQRIRRLMIFDSAGTRFTLNFDPSLFEPDTPAKLQTLDNLLTPGTAPHVPEFVQRAIFGYVHQHGWVVRRNMDSLLTGADLLTAQDLRELKMPMLIVWGREDHLIPLSVGEEIHKDVPQSELEIFDGCGHLAPGQCAAKVGPVVDGFLGEAEPIPGRRAEILEKTH